MYIYEHNCSSFVHSWKAHYFLHIFTFTFTHLADAFIQNDLQLHSGYTFFCQYMCSLGIKPTTFCAADAMLYH